MLKDKIILITGSSSGIGAATARLAREYGATVILHGKTESESLKSLAKELGCEYIFCDVGDKNAVEDGVKRILLKVGKIDILVNSAGIAKGEKFENITDEFVNEVFQVNVLGTIHFCQAVIPKMLENNYGRIVNIASVRGFTNTVRNVVYGMSKASIVNLTASLAKAYAGKIYVNAVAPGFTNTPMAKDWPPHTVEKSKTSLLGRIAEPEEIAEAILFLSSDKASFIDGQTIIVDGGYSISDK